VLDSTNPAGKPLMQLYQAARRTILDSALRADALRVAGSREVSQNGQWVAAPLRAATVQKLEAVILTKARDLRRSSITG
jgi:hypothetical protein